MSLYEEQKIELFNAISLLPDNESLKRVIQYNEKLKELEDKPLKEFVGKTLYKNMMNKKLESGMKKEDAEKQILDLAKNTKQQKILKLKKQFSD